MTLRIVLRIDQSSEELARHLLSIPARRRAARVRTLATIGLMAASGGSVMPPPSGVRSDDLTTREGAVASRRTSLVSSVLRST